MPWSQSQYEQAKSLLGDQSLSEGKRQALMARIALYEDDRARGYNQAPADEGREPQPAINVRGPEVTRDAPKPGPQSFWAPQRPLSTMDYVPEDVGGNLKVWRDVPVEIYKRDVLLPQRETAIAAGEKAMADFRRFGAGAFAPEMQVQMTMAIAQGKAAAAQDPNAITEEDPGYKAFNDQQWQQVVQQRQQDPNAGPIQRHEKVREHGGIAASAAYHLGNLGDKAKAMGQGVLSAFTGGLSTHKMENAGAQGMNMMRPPGMEGMPLDPIAPDAEWNNRADANPLTHGAGTALGSLMPGSMTGMLAKEAFGATARGLAPAAVKAAVAEGAAAPAMTALQRYGAGAVSGGLTAAAEGAGADFSSGVSLGDAAGNVPLRAGVGAAAGLAGQGVADVAGAAARKLSEMTIRGPASRSAFQQAEAAGYDFDPVLGIREPPQVKAARAKALESGEPWSQNFANRAEQRVAENVDAFDAAEAADMARENLAYFKSVNGENLTPMTNMNRQYVQEFAKLRKVSPQLAGRLQDTVSEMETYMDPEGMGNAMEFLSNKLKQANTGNDTLTAKALANLQRALMKDLEVLPKGNLPEGWPALRSEHDVRVGEIKATRDLLQLPSEGLRSPKELQGLNSFLQKGGTLGSQVRAETKATRFMPPELKAEWRMLMGANTLAEMGGPSTGVPYPSRAGLLAGAGRFIAPRAYALSKGVSLQVPESYPVSDKMFAWVNARIPRATQFVPGMDLTKVVRDLAEMQNRPKKWGDLTPEQQNLLLETVATPEQEAVLQETSP